MLKPLTLFTDEMLDILGLSPHTVATRTPKGKVPFQFLQYSNQGLWGKRDAVDSKRKGKGCRTSLKGVKRVSKVIRLVSKH
jgi:hypothetical protein